MSGNGRPIIPGQLAIEVTHSDGPLAQPAVITMPTPGLLKILTIGGLTKVQSLAGEIAAGMVMRSDRERESVSNGYDGTGRRDHELASRALDIAEMILAESHRRNVEAAQQASKPQIEGGAD